MTEDQEHNPSDIHDSSAEDDEQITHSVEHSSCSTSNVPRTASAESKSDCFSFADIFAAQLSQFEQR